MDDIFVYTVKLPPMIREMVAPCADGYTVYISDQLDRTDQITALNHALEHIRNRDFEKYSVQSIEYEIHKKEARNERGKRTVAEGSGLSGEEGTYWLNQ